MKTRKSPTPVKGKPSVVHSIEAIEGLLKKGLSPITDCAQSLRTLGFARAHPEVRSGYESSIWERFGERLALDSRTSPTRERAFLIEAVLVRVTN